jgi:sugar/nucleoside kinase (ribokinase family)
MSILVVGSVAYDTVETPFGKAEKVLGGSASFFSVAASFFVPVNLVGIVGRDFGEKQLAAFAGRDIDITGLERAEGDTFHWQGKYSYDLNSRETICTDLNVFESFKPKIPDAYRKSSHVFLGNIDPVLQRDVLEQVEKPKIVACDTMNFWIEGKTDALKRLLGEVDGLLINDSEARLLAGELNTVVAARRLLSLGLRFLVIKRGEYGAALFAEGHYFAVPAYPVERPVDPTGAGDSFAGGFMGALASGGSLSPDALRRAMIYGSVLASFCVERFSLDRFRTLARAEIDERLEQFRRLTRF